MMSARLCLGLFAVCGLGFAQLSSSDLRAKFGQPLRRETFHMPQGFDLVVDYAPDSQVCKLEVPALMPSKEKVQNLSVMKQRMYEFLTALVPSPMRGKELNRQTVATGAVSVWLVFYEQITISELKHASYPVTGDTITVKFKNTGCAPL